VDVEAVVVVEEVTFAITDKETTLDLALVDLMAVAEVVVAEVLTVLRAEAEAAAELQATETVLQL